MANAKKDRPVAGFDHGAVVSAEAAHGVRSAVTDGQVVELRHDQIRPSPLNPRKHFDVESLDELAASIEASGLLQNLVVRVCDLGGFELIAGERRWRAIGRLIERGAWAPDTPIAARIVDAFDDHQARTLAIIENLQRKDIQPLEEARAMHALKAGGMSVPAIAQAIGMSRRHVEIRIALVTRLVPEVQDALGAGRINLAQARELLPAAPEVQKGLAEKLSKPNVPDYVAQPAAIRSEVRRELIPVERAIFDIEAAGLEIIEDLDGNRMTPRAPFLAAQKAAVEARADALEAEYAWVQVVSWYSPQHWMHAKDLNRPASEGGAIVVFDNNTGSVAVHVGLFKPEEPGAAARKAEIARAQQEREARDEARKAFAAELPMALRPAHGLAAAIAALIVDGEHRNLIQVDIRIDDEMQMAVARRLGISGKTVTAAGVFQGAAKLEQREIIDMLAEIGRSLVGVSHCSMAQDNDIALARHLGITIPAALVPAEAPADGPADDWDEAGDD